MSIEQYISINIFDIVHVFGFLGFGLVANALPPLIQKNGTQASMTNLAEFLIIIFCCCLPKISTSIKT